MKQLMLVIAAILMFGSVAIAEETQTPDATIQFDSTAVAFIAGIEWGSGHVSYQGSDTNVDVRGLSALDVGISALSASGQVYNLKNLDDLEGRYMAWKGEIALGGGVGSVTMKNSKGVIINLTSKKTGVKLALAPEGFRIKLRK